MKKVLITGGAQGLGKEIAEQLKEDYEVVVLDIEKCELDGVTCHICDITDIGQLQKIVSEIGEVDILINNAGVYISGELTDNDYNDIAKVMFVNALGTINTTKAVLPQMKERKSGKIVFVNSIRGVEAREERSVYCASKWAVTGFLKSLRKEVEKYDIEVIGLYPGLMKTNLFENAGVKRDMSEAMDPKEVAEVCKKAIEDGDLVMEDIVFRKLHY
ncbi:SDR family NAD(P)-dependent oxidoreductase [Patescibacteria group bacterium]